MKPKRKCRSSNTDYDPNKDAESSSSDSGDDPKDKIHVHHMHINQSGESAQDLQVESETAQGITVVNQPPETVGRNQAHFGDGVRPMARRHQQTEAVLTRKFK
ncbi:hypothetical protein LOTGIDRAFT_175611 [Lottia gigantea]|uniref:Uncharacterized protein n=1 Tax=Lottia gigantea TaxID=225164 RepID=V4AI96_LOTGI|nr:hypothetical protein LOTGIDRAFT_175611 [Lottia gigantea]ESO93156.1 hypothetical protein LOTGIDRAFT_175611 [Lottia gigantea]